MEPIELKTLLHTVFLRSPKNYFDEFIKECQAWYSNPAHTFTEMRTRANKKIRGDIFEEFCVLYLKEIKGYEIVWRLEDVPCGEATRAFPNGSANRVPEEILQRLSMKRKDMGIDLVVSIGGEFYAVQCKYKAPTVRKSSISWTLMAEP